MAFMSLWTWQRRRGLVPACRSSFGSASKRYTGTAEMFVIQFLTRVPMI